MVWPWGHRRRTQEPAALSPQDFTPPAAHEIASAEHDLQVALALSKSANEVTVTRSRSEEDQLALAKRESMAMVSADSSKAGALSYQYWDSNCLNYDEKVCCGFYDIWGEFPEATQDGHTFPSLASLKKLPGCNDDSREVVLVDYDKDAKLLALVDAAAEAIAGVSHRNDGQRVGIQALARLTASHMGGSGKSDTQLQPEWKRVSGRLQQQQQSVLVSISSLTCGLSRHRALLFKALADFFQIPCRLLRGKFYTGGADDNAVVMVICKKQEWLVDLMIEPGRLLPLRPDVTPQTSTLFRVSGAASEMLNGRRSAEGLDWDQVESSEGPPLIVLSSNDSSELSTSQPQQMSMSAPPLPPSALGSAMIQPFFQNEEMDRFLGYTTAQASSRSPAPFPAPHGILRSSHMSNVQASQNGNYSQMQASQQQLAAGLQSIAAAALDPNNVAPSAPLTPASLLTPSSTIRRPNVTQPEAIMQSSSAMAAPHAQPSRVPPSPFMADAEHSYASPVVPSPAPMAWLRSPFGDQASAAGFGAGIGAGVGADIDAGFGAGLGTGFSPSQHAQQPQVTVDIAAAPDYFVSYADLLGSPQPMEQQSNRLQPKEQQSNMQQPGHPRQSVAMEQTNQHRQQHAQHRQQHQQHRQQHRQEAQQHRQQHQQHRQQHQQQHGRDRTGQGSAAGHQAGASNDALGAGHPGAHSFFDSFPSSASSGGDHIGSLDSQHQTSSGTTTPRRSSSPRPLSPLRNAHPRHMDVRRYLSSDSEPSFQDTPRQREQQARDRAQSSQVGPAYPLATVAQIPNGALSSSDSLPQVEATMPPVEPDEWEIQAEELEFGPRIGIGSFGEVYRGTWRHTDVAIKKFLEQDFSPQLMQEFRAEVGIMKRLKHPNVVMFMGACTQTPNLSIITQFVPRGSLFRLLHRAGQQGALQLNDQRRIRIALDVARGMNYLHSCRPPIVHRDLKSPNLLVDKDLTVKVCDFGLARVRRSTWLSSKSQAGTPEWTAPEVLRSQAYNEKSDVYSFGVILWELCTGQEPWQDKSAMQVVGAVGWANAQLLLSDDMNPALRDIIKTCFKEPQHRPSFGDIISILKPMVQNTPIPPAPPMAHPELINFQRPKPMASPMLASPMLASPMLASPRRSTSQQLPPLESQLSSHQMSSQASPSRTLSQDPANAAGDKFAEVVRRVMHIASNAKTQVGQHVNESPSSHYNGGNPDPHLS